MVDKSRSSDAMQPFVKSVKSRQLDEKRMEKIFYNTAFYPNGGLDVVSSA